MLHCFRLSCKVERAHGHENPEWRLQHHPATEHAQRLHLAVRTRLCADQQPTAGQMQPVAHASALVSSLQPDKCSRSHTPLRWSAAAPTASAVHPCSHFPAFPAFVTHIGTRELIGSREIRRCLTTRSLRRLSLLTRTLAKQVALVLHFCVLHVCMEHAQSGSASQCAVAFLPIRGQPARASACAVHACVLSWRGALRTNSAVRQRQVQA